MNKSENLYFSNGSDELNALSIEILKQQKAAFILWSTLLPINIAGPVLTFLVSLTWKPLLKNDVQILIINLAICHFGISIVALYAALVHIKNATQEIPEVMLISKCFLGVAMQCLFLDVMGCTYLGLSIDRFFASLFPTIYQRKRRFIIPIYIIGIWLIFACLFFGTYFYIRSKPEVSNVYIVVCIARLAVGDILQDFNFYLTLSLNLTTVSLYGISAGVLRIGLFATKTKGGNIEDIKKRMRNKVTKALTINAGIHLVTCGLADIGSFAVRNMAYKGAVQGPYFAAGYGFGGSTNFFVCYICQRQFREGVRSLLKRACFRTNKKNKVGNILISVSNTKMTSLRS